jgi:mycofactocin precursor
VAVTTEGGFTVHVQPDVQTDDTLPVGVTTEPVPDAPADGLVEEDLLVEDVSIDGMCGVY